MKMKSSEAKEEITMKETNVEINHNFKTDTQDRIKKSTWFYVNVFLRKPRPGMTPSNAGARQKIFIAAAVKVTGDINKDQSEWAARRVILWSVENGDLCLDGRWQHLQTYFHVQIF